MGFMCLFFWSVFLVGFCSDWTKVEGDCREALKRDRGSVKVLLFLLCGDNLSWIFPSCNWESFYWVYACFVEIKYELGLDFPLLWLGVFIEFRVWYYIPPVFMLFGPGEIGVGMCWTWIVDLILEKWQNILKVKKKWKKEAKKFVNMII